MQLPDRQSLYDRLGGVYGIALLVDDFIDRVLADPRLNDNPDIEKAHRFVSPSGFKYLMTEMVCWAAGGLQTYSGRLMNSAHQHITISHEEWLAFMDDFHETLAGFEVPPCEQRELITILAAWSGNGTRRLYLAVPRQGDDTGRCGHSELRRDAR